MPPMRIIEGVKVKELRPNADERGFLMEILRADDEIFERFGQVYVSLNYPGVIRAWHYHKKQNDFFAVVKGMTKVVLYDGREDSPTRGEVNEFFLGERRNILLRIPIGVMHGYKTIGVEPSLLLNFPTLVYNPNEPDEYRLPFNSPEVPYNWDLKHG
jgi:dTDP-4-dehydrorhamnose 3,5-epimerase